jgi:hypothetical protein
MCEADALFRSQEKIDMVILLSGTGLRYNDDAIAAGAQTKHRGLAGPVRDLLWRRDFTGRTSSETGERVLS